MLSDDQICVVARAIKDAQPYIPETFHGAIADARPTVAQVIYDFGSGVHIAIHWNTNDPGRIFVIVEIECEHPYVAQHIVPDFRDIVFILERAWMGLLVTLQGRADDHREKAADHEAKAQENERLARCLLGKDNTPTLWDRLEAG
jgi:hypothetical protein